MQGVGFSFRSYRQTLTDTCSSSASNIGSKFSRTDDPRHALMSRWREPALSMHNISIVTGSASKTLISSSVTSTISVRIVPDQSLDTIRKLIKSFLETKFQEFGSTNVLKVEIRHVADWWLGDLESKYLKCLAGCIEKEWVSVPFSTYASYQSY